MIRLVGSDLRGFKALELEPGLNILLADKSEGASDRQTRNGAGKTSLVELIHFVLGANADKGSIFRLPALAPWYFDLAFNLGAQEVAAQRSGSKPSKIIVDGDPSNWPLKPPLEKRRGSFELENEDWKALLGHIWFGLPFNRDSEEKGRFEPSFRSLFSYFARRHPGGFIEPTRFTEKQQPWDQQVSISYLLGLDWTISQKLQELRSQEKMTTELRKAAKGGDLGRFFSKSADLRTRLTVAEARAQRLKDQLQHFTVVPKYAELEAEASSLTRHLSRLNDENTIDRQLILDLSASLHAEVEPALGDVTALYKEAGIVLPGAVKHRFDEVEAFHRAIVANRRAHLSGEVTAAEGRIANREKEKARSDKRRGQIMGILTAGGALESYNRLAEEAARAEAEIESLRLRLEAAERLESTKADHAVKRAQINRALKDDIHDREQIIREAILTFESLSDALYEKEGV